MHRILLLAYLFHCSSAVRVVVTFSSVEDRLSANTSSVPGILEKSFGRRHVLQLGNMTLVEALEVLPVAYMPTSLVSIEEDLVLGAWLPAGEIKGAGYSTTQGVSSPAWSLADDQPYSIHVEYIQQMPNVGPNITVAVLDSGLPLVSHSYFLHLMQGYDFVSTSDQALDGDGRDSEWLDPGDGDPAECPQSSWHGLQVSAVVNTIAPMSVIQPVRVLGRCKTGLASDVSDAVRWAAGGFIQGVPDNAAPAQIISMSFSGLGACPSYLQSSVDFAVSTGAFLIAAAGNNEGNAVDYFPANCNWVVPPLEKYIGHILQLWASLCGSPWLRYCHPVIGCFYSGGSDERWHKLQCGASLWTACSAGCQRNA